MTDAHRPRMPSPTAAWAVFHVRAVIAFCLVAYAGLTFADGPPCGHPPGPPPEAVAACANQAEGARVSFKGHDGQAVAATCKKMGDVLAAWPDSMGKAGPGGGQGGHPPPEGHPGCGKS